MLLNKDAIIKAEDLVSEIVEVPEWGGSVKVRTMTGAERDAYEISFTDKKNKNKQDYTNVRAKLLSRCLVDDKGNRLFSDEEMELLGKKSAKALDRLHDVAQRLNGIGVKEEKEIEKN